MAIRDIGARAVIENLGPFLSGMNQYNQRMQKAIGVTRAFSETSRSVGVALTAISAPLVAFSALSVRTFASFEQSMARVRAITGATPAQFRAMESAAEEMGRTTVFSARQAAGALRFMSQAGLDVETQMTALPRVLELASAAQLDIAQSANIVTNVMAGFGIEVSELSKANDILTIAFTSANTDLTQLATAMKFAGPVARGAGQEFDETAAILARMGNAGIQASMAGTSLRRGIINLINPSRQARQTIDRLGVKVFDASGKMRSMVDILDDLKAAEISTTDAAVIFGARAVSAFLPFLEGGTEGIRALTTEMREMQGVTAEISEIQLDTLTGSLTLLTSASEGLQISLGRVLAPTIRDLAEDIRPILTGLGAWIEAHPTLSKIIAAGAAIVLALGVALIGLSVILPGIAVGVFLLATSGFTLSAAFFPITAIVLGITAAIVAGIFIWRNWATIIEFVKDRANDLIGVLNKVIELMLKANPLFLALERFGLVSAPTIPTFGTGGTMFRSGTALVGERGPELVNLPAGATVSPVSNEVSFNVTANYSNPQEPQSIALDLEALAMQALT